MRPLRASELLEVWERGLAQAPVERALTLCEAACPETPRQALALLSLGRRDARLLALREGTFGSRVQGLAECPACGQRLEFSFSIDDIRDRPETEPETEATITVSGYEVRFRPLNSTDLAAATGSPAPGPGNRLLARCLISARTAGTDQTAQTAQTEGQPAAADELPREVIDAVAGRLARIDPQALVELDVRCPSCGARSRPVFDIASFFWTELDAWARRILREVHILASAYGWREQDILALSPWRRNFYLDQVGA